LRRSSLWCTGEREGGDWQETGGQGWPETKACVKGRGKRVRGMGQGEVDASLRLAEGCLVREPTVKYRDECGLT
jgi:hypothetical protein